MKRIVLALALILAVCSMAMAQDKDPAVSISDLFTNVSKTQLDTGGYYSLIDSNFNYASTFKLWESPKKAYALSVGYAGRAENSKDKLIGTISYDLFKAAKYTTIPILDLLIIKPFVTAGIGRINIKDVTKAEYDIGVGAYLIKIEK